MSALIQELLQYKFKNNELLEDALRSAHRSDQDGTCYDGNRGLAHYGTLATQIAETHDSIVERGKSLHEFNTQKHWSKTKKGRANACSSLGIQTCINKSVRQGNQPPSDTVLDNALSAILGAIWLDCERQEQTTATTRRTLWEVLRNIDEALRNPPHSPSRETHTLPLLFTTPGAIIDQNEAQTGEIDILSEQGHDSIQDFAEGWFEQDFGDVPGETYFDAGFNLDAEMYIIEAEGSLPGGDFVWNTSIQTASPPNTGSYAIGATSNFPSPAPLAQITRQITEGEEFSAAEVSNFHNNSDVLTTGAKRKRPRSRQDKVDPIYQDLLQSESRKLTKFTEHDRKRLRRFLEHQELDSWGVDTTNVLHFLWLAIGSGQTISSFRDQLRQARTKPCIYKRSHTSRWGAMETYNEICRLDNEESLHILFRRYYAIKLCEEESTSDGPHGYIIIETPSTIGESGRSMPGNPHVISKANRTDELVLKVNPTVKRGTEDFSKVRKRVKQLQKLASYLRILINSYGLGILALLPSGASFGQSSLTDSMLTAIDEKKFRKFTTLLRQEQGSLLECLSKALEPAVQALLTYSLDDATEFLVEGIDVSILSSQPKGLLDVVHEPSLPEHTS